MFMLKIKLRNSEKSATYTYEVFDEGVVIDTTDPVLTKYVEIAKKDFGNEIEDLLMKIQFE